MSNSNNAEITVRPGSSLLGVLFVGLKLTGHISWPWVWVLAPFWIPVSISFTLLFFAGVLYAIANHKKKY